MDVESCIYVAIAPLLMLVIAVAVGLILIMLYLPIFQVAEQIQ